MTTAEKCKICGLLINPGECRGTYEVCEAISKAYQKGREDAIDEMLNYVGGDFIAVPAVYGNYQTGYMSAFDDVKKFAEQMKGKEG